MQHPPFEDWDSAYLQTIANPLETADLEKKASAKWDLIADKNGTRAELAKQVCAFSNSCNGFLVYGIEKSGNLDQGVLDVAGTTKLKEWVEQQIPRLLFPPIHNCQAKLIQVSGHHSPDRGALVVYTPLSDRRPHWLNGQGEPSYIRAGEHSFPMIRQTFLDIASRGTAPQAETVGLGIQTTGDFSAATNHMRFNPIVRLLSGPIAKEWAFEIQIQSSDGSINAPGGLTSLPSVCVRSLQHIQIFCTDGPLFPHFPKQVFSMAVSLAIKKEAFEKCEVTTRLYAGDAQPVIKLFRLADECKAKGP